MTHKNHTDSLGLEASSELKETPPDASKEEALQRAIAAIRDLPLEQLEALIHELGMENDPDVMRSLEGIRRGAEVEVLERANAENRDPTIEEVEAAVREVGLENDPKMVRDLKELRDSEKIIKASELMIEAYALLRDLQKSGGESEIEAIAGFLEMSQIAIGGLEECSLESRRLVASKRFDWPVMMELGGEDFRRVVEFWLKEIKLGTEAKGKVRTSALIQNAKIHKFIATRLYLTVKGIHDTKRLKRGEQSHPLRFASLRRDAEEHFKELIRLVDGYGVRKWRKEDKKDFDSKLEKLKDAPEVNEKSFAAWFAACRALLVCITQDQFDLPRHQLRQKGEARAQKGGSDQVFTASAYYKKGIGESLKSSLRSVLKLRPQKKG